MHKKLLLLTAVLIAASVAIAAAKCTRCGSIAPDGWKLCPKCKATAEKAKKAAAKKKAAEDERRRKKEEERNRALKEEEEKRLWNEKEAARRAQEAKEIEEALAAQRKAIDALPPAKWTIEKNVDQITDALSFYISVKGTSIAINSLLDYAPELVFKVTPIRMNGDQMLYKSEWMVIIKTEGLHRNGCEITTRWDKDQAYTTTWATSTDRRAAFAPNPTAFLADVTSHARLTIRFETTLGDIRTTQFYLPGLNAKLKEVKSMYRALVGQ